jgi:hypothetical protein
MKDGKKLVEDFYAKKTGSSNYMDVKMYDDHKEILLNKDIDAVIISTPDHWHAQPAMEAALAGKDIYLQKPTSLTVSGGRQLSNIVQQKGVIFQMGTQQRSMQHILLEAYRYGGGIGYRAIETWGKDNCSILPSEGKTRLDADGSHARWCIVEGESDVPQKRSGILFLSYPANREHPEPMRVWPVDSNGGRGDMYFEFCPIRNTDWKLQTDQDYTLRYRMIVFDGKMSPDEAEIYWQNYAHQPDVEIIK